TIFTDTSTPGNAADLFHWDFGDGHITTTQHPTHTYTETGLFTVTLTITDTDTGETDTKVRVGYITTLPAEWHELNTGQAPLVAGEYSMAYDSARDVVLLYGGNATGWPYEDKTWEFGETGWEIITTTQSPPAVYGASMVYDSSRERIVLFGGSNSADVPLSQTWEFN